MRISRRLYAWIPAVAVAGLIAVASTLALRDPSPRARSLAPTETVTFAPDAGARPVPSAEKEMVDLINAFRDTNDLGALAEESRLRSAARSYSRDMYTRGYLGHIDLEGRTPFDRLRERGIRYAAAAENIAIAPTARMAFGDFIESPDHKRHLLDPRFCEVGVGAYEGASGMIVTVLFLLDPAYGVPPAERCAPNDLPPSAGS